MWRWFFNRMKLMFLVLDLLIERASRGGGSTGPKKTWSPSLTPLHFREEKRRKKERKKKGKERKKKSTPLINSGFGTESKCLVSSLFWPEFSELWNGFLLYTSPNWKMKTKEKGSSQKEPGKK